MSTRRLENRIAVVTGAAQGIGQGCARRFAREGAKVIALDRDEAALNELVRETTSAEGAIEALPAADLTDPAVVKHCFDAIAARHGRIDVMLNAAAFVVFGWIESLAYEDWQRTLRGELDVVFLPVQAAWPLLKASGSASIINFASANAHMALGGSPALAHCAGKGGILAMTRQLAMEGAPHGIRANTISPGLIVTAVTRRHMELDPTFRDKALARSMIKRLGEPEDIAACATWLGTTEAGFVTGADIRVDGGATAW